MDGNVSLKQSEIRDDASAELLCSNCKVNPRRASGRYCFKCHAAYMSAWRLSAVLSDEQREKIRSRGIAGVYYRRGKIKREPCAKCGSPDSQKHHPDYTKPLEVIWLCRPCHLDIHKGDPRPEYRQKQLRRQTAKQSHKVQMIRRLKKIARALDQ